MQRFQGARPLLKVALAAGTILSWGDGAVAQSASLGVEEIVVTARKQNESLQQVPLSVTAFTAKALDAINPRTMLDLNNLSPSLNYQPNSRGGQGRIQMRGTAGGNSGVNKATMFLDGVYLGGAAADINFATIERVEIIPGPQSALFGRATFAGAINYVTKSPTDKFRVHANASVATLGDYEGSVLASGPIIAEKLFFQTDLSYQEFNGPKSWVGTDGKTPLSKTTTKSTTTKFVVAPADDWKIIASANYKVDQDWPTATTTLAPRDRVGSEGSFRKIVPTVDPVNPIAVYPLGKVHYIEQNLFSTIPINPAATAPQTQRIGWRTFARVEWTPGDFTVVATGAHQFERTTGGQAGSVQFPNALAMFNGNPFVGLGRIISKDVDDTFELRATSPQNQRLRYAGGIFYERIYQPQVGPRYLLNTCLSICTATELGTFTRPALGSATLVAQATTVSDKSAFAAIYYDITSQLTASFEARYQVEHSHQQNWSAARGSATVNAPNLGGPSVVPATYVVPATFADMTGIAPIDLAGDFKAFLPRLNVQFKATDDLNFFAVFSQGNNPGSFNTSQFIGVPGTGTTDALRQVKEERIDNYELGMKSQWFDRRLTVNITLYHQYWSNLVTAATYFTPAPNSTFFTANENRGSVTAKGLEGEIIVVPASGWNVRFSGSYVDTKYITFCSNNYAQLTGISDAVAPTVCRNVGGNSADLVPTTHLSLSVGYEGELTGNYSWYTRANVGWQSGMWADEFHFARSYPAITSDAHLGIKDDRLSFEIFCKNCTNDKEPLRLARFSDSRGPGSTNVSNQSIGMLPRSPFQFGVRAIFDY